MVYKYYYSGIHLSNIELMNDESESIHTYLDIFSGQWKETQEKSKITLIYPIDIHRVLKKLKIAQSVDWAIFSDNEEYQLQSDVNGILVWAQRKTSNPIDIITSNGEVVAVTIVDRNGCSVLVKEGFQKKTPLKLWMDEHISNEFRIVNEPIVEMVAMKDGRKLNTLTWLPKEADQVKFSTILLRTPYGVNNYFPWLFKYVMRGFALVIQDVRGREDSEGDWLPFYYEESDGDDTLNHIAEQVWSNQRIGTIGASYSGGVQWAMNASGNEYLKAMMSIVTSGSPFVDIPRRGGAITSGTMAWAFAMADRKIIPQNMIRDDWDELLTHLPINEIPEKGLGKNVEFIDQWMKHQDDDEFWKKMDWSNSKMSDVPAMFVSGWYDDDGMGTSQAWDLCVKQNRKNIKMILGPWLHAANTTRDINDISFGNNSLRYDLDLMEFMWFEHHLNQTNNKINDISNVQYYLNGKNEWKESEHWPPLEKRDTQLFLSEEKKATFECPSITGVSEYSFDPKNSTPFLIDISTNECNIPANYCDIEKREDVLIFSSDRLTEDVVITGDLKAKIFASSSCLDTDWVVRVTEVVDERTSIRISDGLLRARYRDGFEKQNLLTPNQIYPFDINMFKIAHQFKKGHRIRIAITSGAKNLIFPNHNTGNDPATDRIYKIAEQKIYFGKDYPSHIVLPIIK